jgi:hypothetical protein
VEQREQRIEQQIAVREVPHVQLCGLWVLMLARPHDGVTGLAFTARAADRFARQGVRSTSHLQGTFWLT